MDARSRIAAEMAGLFCMMCSIQCRDAREEDAAGKLQIKRPRAFVYGNVF